jgi:hypothetical protein
MNMATPSEKLAESLDLLRELQDKGIVAIKSDNLTRTYRERLLENGFIQEVYKGWYLAISPEAPKGDSSAWYSNYWQFCSQLLEDRFGKKWCISPEQSMLLHAGNASVPGQLIVRSPAANNSNTDLPFHTSLFLLRADMPPATETAEMDGIRIYSLPAALVRVAPNIYIHNEIDIRTALSIIREPSDILSLLLDGGHSVIAGRLAGAFRNNNQDKISENIIKTMEKAGYDIRETDPFDAKAIVIISSRSHSPYENRIRIMWQAMRDKVLHHFLPAPGIPTNKNSYMQAVEKVYLTDAYHSLSIEKYKVTPALIEKVRMEKWNTKENKEDRKERNAMAAKGYWDAFQAVEHSIGRILDGENPGSVADEDHSGWYRELFGPSIAAGLLKPSDLAGYRNHQVYIGGSMRTPLNREAVRDVMPVLFELLASEKEAAVRAVLGHFIFVYIHPYMDGNGRMGRFLMNAMLASGGYPWTVIPVEEREKYMHTLERASVGQDIEPFAQFLGYLVAEGMRGKPVAKI